MAKFVDLKLQLVNARPPKAPRMEDKPKDKSNVTCYECQEKGHYHPECSKLRKREEKSIALLEEIGSEEEEQQQTLMPLMAIRGRKTRSDEEEEEEKEQKHKKKKKSSRRKIGQSDFPLGQGILTYDLLTDLREKTAPNHIWATSGTLSKT